MAIEYYGDIITKYEQIHKKPYIGYFSPEGTLVDYNSEKNESHTYLDNIVAWTFLLWVQDSFDEFRNKDIKIEFNLDNPTNKNKNILILQRDLLNFLRMAENDQNFINTLRSKIDFERIPNYNDQNDNLFGRYNTRELLFFLKDICVEYLGYDSIEQITPDAKMLEFNHNHFDPRSEEDKPRFITTSNLNVNDRFYNYLLMNWKIQRVPRYTYDSEKNMFTKDINEVLSFQSEKDMAFEEEIRSIKKLVPLKEREKYFR